MEQRKRNRRPAQGPCRRLQEAAGRACQAKEARGKKQKAERKEQAEIAKKEQELARLDHQTHPVGQKQPNGLGIYDMSGNVWERCSDWYKSNYYESSPKDNPQGPLSGTRRVLRGSSWYSGPRYVRAASRDSIDPGGSFIFLGFRLVRSK